MNYDYKVRIEGLQAENDALKAEHDGYAEQFRLQAGCLKVARENEDRVRSERDKLRAEVAELKRRVPVYLCSTCHTEADPACPDPSDPELVVCEPCSEVVRLKAEVEEALGLLRDYLDTVEFYNRAGIEMLPRYRRLVFVPARAFLALKHPAPAPKETSDE